jgi:hypothetical protein
MGRMSTYQGPVILSKSFRPSRRSSIARIQIRLHRNSPRKTGIGTAQPQTRFASFKEMLANPLFFSIFSPPGIGLLRPVTSGSPHQVIPVSNEREMLAMLQCIARNYY